jgi:hypothetical protein
MAALGGLLIPLALTSLALAARGDGNMRPELAGRLRRATEYRRDHPATYPASWATDSSSASEWARKLVGECLRGSLENPAR